MNWFKKSIAYDQRRNLLVFPILIIVSNIINIAAIREQILFSKLDIGSLYIIHNQLVYVVNLALVALIAVASFGFRGVSERNYMPSMPMKRVDITLTKYSCAMLFSILPLVLGFIMESILYISNKEYLYQEGYFYSSVFARNINIILVSMILVSLIFFIGHLYSNIKVAAALSISGGIAGIYFISVVRNIFDYDSVFRQNIDEVGNFIFDMLFSSMGDKYLYNQSALGIVIFLVGFVLLIYFLIDFIASRFVNDIYDSLHPFKISKIITITLLTIIMMAITMFISGLAFEIFYILPMSRRPVEEQVDNILSLSAKVQLIAAVVLSPLWVFLSRKINKKLEERF